MSADTKTSPVAPTFWMVWSPQGQAPTVRHPSHKSAEHEAHRLAELNPQAEFFVLKAKRRVAHVGEQAQAAAEVA